MRLVRSDQTPDKTVRAIKESSKRAKAFFDLDPNPAFIIGDPLSPSAEFVSSQDLKKSKPRKQEKRRK